MDLQREFPLKDDLIYLNHAAVSPWPSRTCQVVKQFAEENNTVGSANYLTWLEVEAQLRNRIKRLINAPSTHDIALLKNTSEALSVVAYGIQWQPGDNVVISEEEFPSNRIVWESLQSQGVKVRKAGLNSLACPPEKVLMSLCDKNTRLLSISSIQYASGLRLDLQSLGTFCRNRDILFCVDAIQSVGAVAFDVQKYHIDFAMADGHKWMLGPEGLAFFYTTPRAREVLKLTQYGWHMVEQVGDFDREDWSVARDSRRFECGSPNMLGIHALNASISLLLEAGIDTVEKEVLKRSKYIIDAVMESRQLTLLSHSDISRCGGIVTFKHNRIDTEALYATLVESGVVCAMRGGGIRFSPHFYTPVNKIQKALDILST